MLKSKRILIPVAMLLIVSLACSAQGNVIPTLDPNLANTAIFQTVVAAGTQTSQAFIPVTGQNTATPLTPELPTLTPTATASPLPLFTATPSVPLISVSVATNCRVGPGKIYGLVGALLVGEVAEVYGRDITGSYWYIRNPDVNNGFCWLWGEYASLVGNTGALPIFTPPPTPTPVPAFEAEYTGLGHCATSWWAEIRLENSGGAIFKSMTFTLRDTVTNTVVTASVDGFTNHNGCNVVKDIKQLEPGQRHIVSAPAFNYDPTGHKLRATLTLCTEKAQGGLCVSQVLNFTP